MSVDNLGHGAARQQPGNAPGASRVAARDARAAGVAHARRRRRVRPPLAAVPRPAARACPRRLPGGLRRVCGWGRVSALAAKHGSVAGDIPRRARQSSPRCNPWIPLQPVDCGGMPAAPTVPLRKPCRGDRLINDLGSVSSSERAMLTSEENHQRPRGKAAPPKRHAHDLRRDWPQRSADGRGLLPALPRRSTSQPGAGSTTRRCECAAVGTLWGYIVSSLRHAHHASPRVTFAVRQGVG